MEGENQNVDLNQSPNDNQNESNEEIKSNSSRVRISNGGILQKIRKHIILFIVIIALIVIMIIAGYKKMVVDRGIEDPYDPQNAPYAVSSFINNVYLDEDGNLRMQKSIKELWEELEKNNNDIMKYLDSPEELAKLISASMAVDYPDLRSNPDDEIDWKKMDLNINSTSVQGIVKFKRALQDGKTITMTYLPEEEFQEKINKYNGSGKKEDRDEALKYFTLEKSYDNAESGYVDVGTRPFNSSTFNVDSNIDVYSITNRLFGNKYDAIQGCCFDGKYIICSGNRGKHGNVGGRVFWVNATTKKVEGSSVEVGYEGGHMEGMTYDSNRKMVLCVVSGKKLLQINNQTRQKAGYANVKQNFRQLAYSVTTHELLGFNGGKNTVTFMKYNSSTNTYEEQRTIKLNNAHFSNIQGIASDGQVIYLSDSRPSSEMSPSKYRVWVYDFQGNKVEEHKMGSGFKRGTEVENCYADKNGNLWLVMPHEVVKVKDYKAHPVDWENDLSSVEQPGRTSSATGSFEQVQEILKYACSWQGKISYKLGGSGHLKEGGNSDCSHFVHRVFGHFGLMDDSSKGFVHSLDWGKGGGNGGCPGTKNIGTDMSKASPGDVIWEHYGSGSHNHVYIYMGKGKDGKYKKIQCAKTDHKSGVYISNIDTKQVDGILHFDSLPQDPNAYFDPDTGILHTSSGSSVSNSTSTTSSNTSTTSSNTTTNDSSSSNNNSQVNYNNNDTFNADPNARIDPTQGMKVQRGEHRTYRAVQSACYDGRHVICAQNKNYGDIKASSKGGRIAWIDMETGKYVGSIEIGKEGGHMDGVAYDSDRNMVLKPSSSKEGNLIQIDNSTRQLASPSHVKMTKYCNKLTYVPSLHQLIGLDDGKFHFLKWDEGKKQYVKQKEVKLENYHTKCGAQGIGTDGKVIFIADSGPGISSSKYRIWVYSFEGKLLGEHKLGTGYHEVKEVESAFGDKYGNLWLVNPRDIEKVANYKVNATDVSASTSDSTNSTTSENQQGGKFKVKIATWQESETKVESTENYEDMYDRSYNMSTISIPYQEAVAQYRMPFNYLFAMLLVSRDQSYTFDLAGLVKNSKIEITAHDNYNKTKTVDTEDYTTNYYYEGQANASFKYKYTITSEDPTQPSTTDTGSGSLDRLFKAKAEEHIPYHKKTTTINQSITSEVALTLADAWCVKYEKKYKYNGDTSTPGEIQKTTLDDQLEDSDENGRITNGEVRSSIENQAFAEASSWIRNQGLDGRVTSVNLENEKEFVDCTTTDHVLTNKVDTETSSYTGEPEEFTEDTHGRKRFVDVFNEHENASGNILSRTSTLFKILAGNQDTVNMVDLTKYLIYRASGMKIDDVTTYNFKVYDMQNIGSNSGGGNGTLGMTSTTLSKEQFVQFTQSYSAALSNSSGTKVFRDNAGVIYDVCVKNGVNPVLCSAQGWAEQNWDDPSTSPFNYWGIAVYNNQNYGNSYSSMEQAVEGYCKQINERLKGGNGALEWSKSNAKYNNKFTGSISTVYDILSNWACADDWKTNPAHQAEHAANYVDKVISIAKTIYGEGALETSLNSASGVVQFALKYEGKRASEFNLFNYTSKHGATDRWFADEWCAMFVSFCFDNCGLIPSPLTDSYSSCSDGWGRLGERQEKSAARGGNYIPKSGDIIYFGANAGQHTGIVVKSDSSKVYTIEGNTSGDQFNNTIVSQNSYALNNSWIWGYGRMSN